MNRGLYFGVVFAGFSAVVAEMADILEAYHVFVLLLPVFLISEAADLGIEVMAVFIVKL